MLREDDLNWEGHESHGVQIPARAATSWHRGGTAGAMHPLRRGVADLCRARRVMYLCSKPSVAS